MQSNVENHILGRVSSLFSIVTRTGIFISAFYTGLVQESLHWPVGLTIQSLGLMGIASGVLALWGYRRERKATVEEEVPAAGV